MSGREKERSEKDIITSTTTTSRIKIHFTLRVTKFTIIVFKGHTDCWVTTKDAIGSWMITEVRIKDSFQ